MEPPRYLGLFSCLMPKWSACALRAQALAPFGRQRCFLELQRAAIGAPRPPQRASKDPLRTPKDPQGTPKNPPRTIQGPPRTLQGARRDVSEPPMLPKAAPKAPEGSPRLSQEPQNAQNRQTTICFLCFYKPSNCFISATKASPGTQKSSPSAS